MKKCNIDNTVPSIRNTKCVSNIMWMKKIIYTEVESGKSLVNENLNLHIKFLWVAWRLILKVMFFQLFLKIYKALKQNYSSWKREKAQFLCFISRKPSKLALKKRLKLHFGEPVRFRQTVLNVACLFFSFSLLACMTK